MTLERDIEKYLVKRVKELKGVVRKIKWIGQRNAPDRLVLLPARTVLPTPENRSTVRSARAVWVELKNPETIKTFPANAHERAQYREHQRMRKLGQRVEVIGTFAQVDGLLG